MAKEQNQNISLNPKQNFSGLKKQVNRYLTKSELAEKRKKAKQASIEIQKYIQSQKKENLPAK